MSTVTRMKGMGYQRQRGAVAIMFGLTLVVLIGFAGLAIDLGRFFVIKSELQNAMDACALSAASQLRPGASDTKALERATAYGNVFSKGELSDPSVWNRANFQSKELDQSVLEITFASSNSGPFKTIVLADTNTAKYVKCQYPYANLPIFFMQVLNPLMTTQTVSAMAVAKRELPTSSCLPVVVCANGTTSPYGLTKGQWLTVISGPGQNVGGFFGWGILSSPGGANQMKDALSGSYQCDVSVTGQQLYGSGLMSGLTKEWNTRFGLYASATDPDSAPPDFTGYAYSDEAGGNWPPIPPATAGFNAYSGNNSLSPTIPNFETISASLVLADKQYQNSPQPSDFPLNKYPKLQPPEAQKEKGRLYRRITAAPIAQCPVGNGPFTNVVQDWSCLLMLNPFDESGPQTATRRKAKVEFLGLASEANSPCAGGSSEAVAPVLTQ